MSATAAHKATVRALPRVRVAFLFPGDGSAGFGMEAGMQAVDPDRYDAWMQAAEAASGLPLRHYVSDGPMSAAARCDVVQPAVTALSLALAETAHSIGLRPDFAAGHGLGEYAAAVTAGVLSGEDALVLAAERGRLMEAACRKQSGATGYVHGLSPEVVERVCAQTRQRFGYVAVASIDARHRATISGNASSVARAIGLATRFGATAGLLSSNLAAHSSLMSMVSARLRRVAARMTWHDARVPLVSNAGGRILASGASIRAALVNQPALSVRWTDCMDTMLAAGCGHFVELGPGRVLTELAREHDRDLVAVSADHLTTSAGFVGRGASVRLAA